MDGISTIPEQPANGNLASDLIDDHNSDEQWRSLEFGDGSVYYGAMSSVNKPDLQTKMTDGGTEMVPDDPSSIVDPTPSELTSEADVEEEGEPCGWGPLKPAWCQMFRNPKVVLICFCLAGATQGMIVNGFISVVITTIERRFDLASTETGIIASSYDIASVLCLIPISYIGGFGRKPRWVGTGVFLVGLGSFLFALPHFTTGLYNYESVREHNQCFLKPVNQTNLCSADSESSILSKYKYMFILAQLLHGAGCTPIYTVGITYMDENLKPKMTPVYVGIFYAMSIIGPSVGYLVGGEFLKRYTDIGAVDVSRLEIDPDSPMWVGAWWIGFLMSGTLALVVSLPIQGFPRSLPGGRNLKAERASEVYRGSDNSASRPGFGTSIRDIPVVIKLLITNPTFMFLNMAGAAEGLLVTGFVVFAPKFIESQFSISAGLAAQLVGFATIPTGGGGTFLGGYLVKRLDLKCAGILKMCMCTSFTSLLTILVFLIRCPNAEFVGVNVDYAAHSNLLKANLTGACNSHCHCDLTRYDPVCGIDKSMYFSPCYAGCKVASELNGKKLFSNCSCIDSSLKHSLPDVTLQSVAYEGKCTSDCQLLGLFLPVFSLAIFFTFCTSMPALSATLRCVPEKQRSLALGIQWILVRCLGSIPAPIFFGALIDKTCQLWQKTCDNNGGSCLFYDNATMGHYLLALSICAKGFAVFFFFMALTLYKPPPKPSALPTLPGDQLSTSSTMQMIVHNKTSVDSQLSHIVPTPGGNSRNPEGRQGSRVSSRFQEPSRAGQKSSPPTSTAQAKYKLVSQ